MTSSVDILDYMLKEFPNLKEAYDFYQNFLLSISKNDAMIESNGINLRVPLELLRKNGNEVVLPKKGGVSLSVDKPKTASLSLDLHGMRADEAIAKLDKFI